MLGYFLLYKSAIGVHISSVHLVVSNSLRPDGLQHISLPCPSPTPGACSDSCPSSQWCHPTSSSSVVPFSCLQSFPASGSFPMNQFFASGGQSIGASASASVLPMNIQDWFPLGWTGWISRCTYIPSVFLPFLDLQLKPSSEPHSSCQELSSSSEFLCFPAANLPQGGYLISMGQSPGREPCPERKISIVA